MTTAGGALSGVKVNCVNCSTTGMIEQEFHLELDPNGLDDDDGDDDDDDDWFWDPFKKPKPRRNFRRGDVDGSNYDMQIYADKDDDDDDDDFDFHQAISDHIKRAWVRWTVTEEVRIQKQVEVLVTGGIDFTCNVNIWGIPYPGPPQCKPKPNFTGGGVNWEKTSSTSVKKKNAEEHMKKINPKKNKKGKLQVSDMYSLYAVMLIIINDV